MPTALFFLNRWNESRPQGLADNDRQLARSFALRVIAGQQSQGIWGYDGVLLTLAEEADLLAVLKKGIHKPNRPRHPAVGYSISNTQFAMLALWGARKHGLPVRNTLLATAGHFHTTQLPKGNWSYGDANWPQSALSTSSTCAGLIALAIEKALLEDEEFVRLPQKNGDGKQKADGNKAFAYLAQTINRKKGDPGEATHQFKGTIFQADSWRDLYFLWSVERIGMIYGKDQIDGKDWYEWGYPIVLKTQKEDGRWQDRHGPLVDTCFALLFLKRANIAKDLTEMIRMRGGKEAIP